MEGSESFPNLVFLDRYNDPKKYQNSLVIAD